MSTVWIALTFVAFAQDDAELARGERFLARAAEAWRKGSPVEERLGIFVGRQWVGEAILKARSTNEGFQIEITSKHELAGSKVEVDLQLGATDTLKLIRGTMKIQIEMPGARNRISSTFSRKEEVVEGTIDEDGEKKAWKANVGPGGAIPQPLLLFLARRLDPKDRERLALFEFGDKAIRTTITAVDPKKIRLGGHEVECVTVNLKSEEESYVAYFDSTSQEFLEIRRVREQGILRYRPIKPEHVGKNLDEPQDLTNPEKVYVDFGWAVQKGDAEALRRLIDFERMTKEAFNGFDKFSEKEKQETIKDMRESLVEALTGKDMRTVPGFSAVLEAANSDLFESKIDGPKAIVRFKYKGAFTLYMHRTGEGKDERWLIYQIK